MVNVKPFYFAFEWRTQASYIDGSMVRLVSTMLLLALAGPATLLAQTAAAPAVGRRRRRRRAVCRSRSRRPVSRRRVRRRCRRAHRAGPRPRAPLRRGRLRVDRSVDRPRRRRHRLERHRGHARAQGRLRRHASLLSVPRGPERPLRRRRTISFARRPARAGASARSSGTIAYEILLAAERDHGIVAVSYEDDVHPYSDLLIGTARRGAARQRAGRAAEPDDARVSSRIPSRSRCRITSACSRRATTRFAIGSIRF